MPKNVAGSVLVQLTNGDGTTNVANAALGEGSYVEAILRGPAFTARPIVGRPNETLLLPPLSLVGGYQLDGIRIVDAATRATRLDGNPGSFPVQVFNQVLVSKVTSRPFSL